MKLPKSRCVGCSYYKPTYGNNHGSKCCHYALYTGSCWSANETECTHYTRGKTPRKDLEGMKDVYSM